MRKIAASTAGLLALTIASGASAADLPRKSVAPVVAAPAFTWTGFYVGANAGFGWGGNTGAGHTILVDAFGGLAGFFAAGGNVLRASVRRASSAAVRSATTGRSRRTSFSDWSPTSRRPA